MFVMCLWSGLCYAGVYTVKRWTSRTLTSYNLTLKTSVEIHIKYEWNTHLILVSVSRSTFQSVYNIYGSFWPLGGIN